MPMMPTILDPGYLALADTPLPPSTGPKLKPPARYVEASDGQTYLVDSDGTWYQTQAIEPLFKWPAELTHTDGAKQMAPAMAGSTAIERHGRRSNTPGALARRRRRKGERSGRRAVAHDGPADFAYAEALALASGRVSGVSGVSGVSWVSDGCRVSDGCAADRARRISR
jgi:hypothetical protein